MLNELAKRIHENNVYKGFYDTPVEIGTRIALIHSELSEALESDRKGKYTNVIEFEGLFEENDSNTFKLIFEETVKDTFEDEIADTIIRLLDLCGHMNIDIDSHVQAKVRYNLLRPYKHGKVY